MRAHLSWNNEIPEVDGQKIPVNCVVYSVDGSQLIAAVGNLVVIYNAVVGNIIKKLKGHNDTVYCLSCATNGEIFASGGQDKTVIIWTSSGEGKLKYAHNDSIQCISFNPISNELVTCTANDIGIWNPNQEEVKKCKVASKVLSCSWTSDGQHLALGHFNGQISIRYKDLREKVSIVRNSPIWTLAWNPKREDSSDILAVGCWDQTLSFYSVEGKAEHKERQLECDPLSISYFNNGQYMFVSGSDGKVTMWTKEGVKLLNVCEEVDWVWSASPRSNENFLALGTNDSKVKVYQLLFGTVHSLYQDQYAYRELMTNVVIHDLLTDRKLKIHCEDYVKKISIYRDRLAVQLPEKIVIYEVYEDESDEELKYILRDEITKKLDCHYLVVTSRSVILFQESTLQMYDFQGNMEREWVLDATIKYIKVIGGPPTREALLLGLQNGSVLKIFVDNPFPVKLLKLNTPIKYLDLSSSRQKLAIVDGSNSCVVYSLKTKEFLFKESNALSVAWNTEYEDMLCFSGNGVINIKTGNFPVHQQKLQGYSVVGFKGSKLYCWHLVSVTTVDIPQSASLYRYLDKKDFSNAYKIACLGVTENDWRLLAMQALIGLDFDTARSAFVRIRDMKYITLLNRIEQQMKQKNYNENLFLAQIYAYQGRFEEAAQLFVKSGQAETALEMLCDLGLWREARTLSETCNTINLSSLILKQAKVAEEDGDMRTAAELYVGANEYHKAITIMGENGWLEMLIGVCRILKQMDEKAIALCGRYFQSYGHHDYAKEAYSKINDIDALMKLHIEMQKWDDAFEILKQFPKYSSDLYLPYALYLAVNDRYDESQEAFKKAGKPLEALNMLEILGNNSIVEHRFRDGAYYYWKLAIENLIVVKNEDKQTDEVKNRIGAFEKFYRLSKIYYAYDYIHRYSELPFNSMPSDYLFNIARYLLIAISHDVPHNISKVKIIMALANFGTELGAYKLAREAYQKLQYLRIPKTMIDELELASIAINSKPVSNKEDLTPLCYRCSSTNPFLNNNGDCCASCAHPFVKSGYSFETLPLVEFEVENLTNEEVLELMRQDSFFVSSVSKGTQDLFREEEGSQSLTFEPSSDSPSNDGTDLFTRAQLNFETNKSPRVKINLKTLKSLRKEDIFIVEWPCKYVKVRFYKNLYPKEHILSQCQSCNTFFHEDHYIFETLKQGGCPFCRHKQKSNDISNEEVNTP